MRTIIMAAVASVALAGAGAANTVTSTYTSFYSFGDSLSDDGKFAALDAPSLGGRFSNDLVWVERIAAEFAAAGKDTGNLALGGATAGRVNLNPAGPLSTFRGQVDTFKGALRAGVGLPTKLLPVPQFSPTAPTPGSNPLVSILFGANDIFQGFNPKRAATAVASNIRRISRISSHEFNDFLLANLPDIGKTPAFAGAGSASATAASAMFNLQLAKHVKRLEARGLNIIGFDADAVLEEILDDIESGTFKYGILDANTPCTISVGYALDPNNSNPGSCVDLGIDPNRLLFIDGVHPNGVAHALFAERATQAVADNIAANTAAVPVPAALPLLLTALAGFGLIGRRRRAA